MFTFEINSDYTNLRCLLKAKEIFHNILLVQFFLELNLAYIFSIDPGPGWIILILKAWAFLLMVVHYETYTKNMLHEYLFRNGCDVI